MLPLWFRLDISIIEIYKKVINSEVLENPVFPQSQMDFMAEVQNLGCKITRGL